MGVEIMKTIFRQNQLFTFLLYCNGQGLEKNILDCGAGGGCPPLAIFKDHGYETYGIDIDEEEIQRAKEFEEKHNLELNISKGDMRNLKFEDEYFSYIYSYNTIFHMSKEEISTLFCISTITLHRVLKQLKEADIITVNSKGVVITKEQYNKFIHKFKEMRDKL